MDSNSILCIYTRIILAFVTEAISIDLSTLPSGHLSHQSHLTAAERSNPMCPLRASHVVVDLQLRKDLLPGAICFAAYRLVHRSFRHHALPHPQRADRPHRRRYDLDRRLDGKVLVSYPTDGNSYETYAIAGERSAGDCWIQGTAARRSTVGNRLEIMAFDVTDESESPRMILVDEYNRFV